MIDLNLPLWCGLISGALSAVAFLPYTYATLKGRCRPQRASWLIWMVLGSISLFSQWVEGAQASLWFAAVQVMGAGLVAILSIRHGAGSFVSRQDGAILTLAGAGLVTYFLTDTAAYALAITIAISALGGVATVIKAFNAPDSEAISAWVAGTVGSFFAILAVIPPVPLLLAYPVYMLGMNGAVVIAILWGRNRRNRSCLPGGIAW
ncbi:hypothetical protein J4E08_18040 [Sagittula sp. NFXS13]|uniref:hypothetical protein n=1 Tax=Sagittula sp. NFXS13 TaxID=2819095 RepID=UPI0032DEF00C